MLHIAFVSELEPFAGTGGSKVIDRKWSERKCHPLFTASIFTFHINARVAITLIYF